MMIDNKFYWSKGYSLIEMAVVLIIIGLLVGGVIAGQQLVQAAKINSVIKELNVYQSAVLMFRDKFQYFPGDMPNASTVFNSANCTNPTCDGNGDERITTNNEQFRAWQHLNLAGFTAKVFGDSGIAQNELPKAKIDRGYFAIRTITVYGTTKNFLELGAISNSANAQADANVLTPIDALNIDAKLDDGVATTGNILGVTGLDANTFAALPANTCADPGFSNSQYTTTNVNAVLCKILYALE